MDVKSLAESVLQRVNLAIDIKDKQVEALELLMQKKDVFCVLPTGFGKSLIYWLLADMMDQAEHKEGHITIVVCPLRSLMKDQVAACKPHFSCVAILRRDEMSEEEIFGLQSGLYKIVFTSPEAVTEPYWFAWLKQVESNICAVVYDEAHCIITWGESFRRDYMRVTKIRAVLGNVPVLATTATATESMISSIGEKFGITHFERVSRVSDRPNIYLEFGPKPSTIGDLQWYIDQLVAKKENTPKSVIFCRSTGQVTNLYKEIVTITEELDLDDDYVEMYHAKIDEATKLIIEEDFRSTTSTRRCLITTIAYGMGVQVPDIRYAIHWGPPESLFDYWQEVGRCARDGSDGHAIMYFPAHSISKAVCDDKMLELVRKENPGCLRLATLKALQVKGMEETEIASCCGGSRCCSSCDTGDAMHKN